jgi:uncharacterized RDD family membrane protein YckC
VSNPYAPPGAKVSDHEISASEIRYASFWLRFGAFVIDMVLLLVIIVPLLLWIYGIEFYLDKNSPMIAGPADILISYVFPVVATLIFWKYRQATPGKMLLNMRIVDADAFGPLSTGQLFGRYFAYLVSMIPVFLGFLWIAWDARKQSFHDKLAGTVVIRT